MSDSDIIHNRVKTVGSGTPGRAIGEIRHHHFVIDDPSIGEALTAADYFVSGIAGCAANHIELKAATLGLPVTKIEVELDARRPRADTSVFLGIDIIVGFHGTIGDDDAAALLDSYAQACPLYKSVAGFTTVGLTYQLRG